MVGWAMRSFRTRSTSTLLFTFKSLVQINRIERVQKSLLSRILDSRLDGLDYWQKLKLLRFYSQERRSEGYDVIFLRKLRVLRVKKLLERITLSVLQGKRTNEQM